MRETNLQSKLLSFLLIFAVPPKVTLPKKVLIGREQTVTVICEVEGNPKPVISWSGCDQPNHLCDKQYLRVSKVQNPRTNYTCTGRNYLGSDSATIVLSK